MKICFQKNIVRFLYLILSVVLILLFNTVYIDSYRGFKNMIIIIFLGLSLLIFIFLLPKVMKDSLLKTFIIIFSLLVVFFFILNSFMYGFNEIHLITFLVIPVIYTSFFYFNRDKDNTFLRMIENLIIVDACISFVFWIMSNIGVNFNSSIFVYWGGTKNIPGYFDISFVTQSFKVGNMTLIRNSSFFSETPVYAYLLSMSLLIELFVVNGKKRNLRTYILLITILSTISTTGIVIAVTAIGYYYLFIYKNNSLLFLLRLKKLIFIILAIIIVCVVLYEKIIVSDGSSALSSSNIRADDFKACFLTFMQHPFIGNGLDNFDSIVRNMNPIRYGINTGLSTGMMTALAFGGVYLLLFYISPLFTSFRCSKKEIGLGLFTFLLTLFIVGYESYVYVILSSYIYAMYLRKKICN